MNRYRIWEIHNETGHKEFYINLVAGDDEEANKRLRELQECCNKHNDNVTLQITGKTELCMALNGQVSTKTGE